MLIKDVISRGNIVRTEYKENVEAGCYLGNGRFGTVIGPLGLNMSPDMQKKYPKVGSSHFSHMAHWGRFEFISSAMNKQTSADYLLPLFKMHWENENVKISDYKQCHDFYSGTVETSFSLECGSKIKTLAWFDRVNKDLAGVNVEISNGSFPIKISTVTEFIPYEFLYRTPTAQTTKVEQVGDNWRVSIACEDTANNRCTDVYFYSTAPVVACEDGITILAAQGNNSIFVSVGKPVEIEDTKHSLERTVKSWNEEWEKCGWFDFPEQTTQNVWVRSMAYMISSYDDDFGFIQPTNGLSGNVFPFHFVQDMEYISPAMMMMGRADIIKTWVEKFAERIDDMKEYVKKLWPESDGLCPPWELPHGSIKGYHDTSVPVIYCYEPHNPAYLCRLAKEAADFIGDEAWTKKYVHPLVEEICKFYKSACRKEDDGLWHLEWYPCIGQDEAGGRNKKDYLCSLYSAKYSFKIAVEYGLDPDGIYAKILADGLSFDSLACDRGTLHTAHDADDFGKQKHPVQLDGLSYFPIEAAPLPYERKAYELRHDITQGAKDPVFFGWTLGQFLLTGSNIKDPDGWLKDWANMRASDYTDDEWIQIYESSSEGYKSFYVTTHGMVLQSLIRNYVNDYWGVIDIAGCPIYGDKKVSFGNISTRLGVKVSGVVEGRRMSLSLDAMKDCEITVNSKPVTLKKGETKQLEF